MIDMIFFLLREGWTSKSSLKLIVNAGNVTFNRLNVIRQWNMHSNYERKRDGSTARWMRQWSVIKPPIMFPLYTSTSLVTSINISINSISRKQSCESVIMIEKMIRLIIDN